MKKKVIKLFIILFMIQLIITSSLLIRKSYAAAEDFEPDYGFAPNIDGEIDKDQKEWENASKETIRLYKDPRSENDFGIETEIWVLQNESDLYISVQFELANHPSEEYIAIIISESDSETNTSFYDAKIVQFYNLGQPNEDVKYYDYYLDNDLNFIEDSHENGEGDAKLDDEKAIYEFRIPVNESEDEDSKDVNLEYGDEYAFKVFYGETSNYNFEGTTHERESIVKIKIEYPDKKEIEPWSVARFVFLIISFSVLGVLYSFYIYKILIIKTKLRRIRE
ncbi:MAG: hypothetical protein ACFFAO_18770 [Candidatus Hermodarchaeota archaeon]